MMVCMYSFLFPLSQVLTPDCNTGGGRSDSDEQWCISVPHLYPTLNSRYTNNVSIDNNIYPSLPPRRTNGVRKLRTSLLLAHLLGLFRGHSDCVGLNAASLGWDYSGSYRSLRFPLWPEDGRYDLQSILSSVCYACSDHRCRRMF